MLTRLVIFVCLAGLAFAQDCGREEAAACNDEVMGVLKRCRESGANDLMRCMRRYLAESRCGFCMCTVLEMNGLDWCDHEHTRPDEPTRPTGRPDPEECDRETAAACNDEVMGVLERCRAGQVDDLLGCMRRYLAESRCGFCMCQVLEMNGFDLCDHEPTRPDEPTRSTGRPDPEECDRETAAACNDEVMGVLERCRAGQVDDLLGCMRRYLAESRCGFCMCTVLEMNGFDWCDHEPTRPDEPTRPTGRPDPEECDRETAAACNDEVMGVLQRCRAGQVDDLLGCMRRYLAESRCGFCMCQVLEMNGFDLCDHEPTRPDEPTRPTGRPDPEECDRDTAAACNDEVMGVLERCRAGQVDDLIDCMRRFLAESRCGFCMCQVLEMNGFDWCDHEPTRPDEPTRPTGRPDPEECDRETAAACNDEVMGVLERCRAGQVDNLLGCMRRYLAESRCGFCMCQVLEMNGFDWCDHEPTRPDEPTRPTGRHDPEECDRETAAACNDIVMGVVERCRASGADNLLGCVRRYLADTRCAVCMCQILEINGLDWCDSEPTRPTRPDEPTRPTERPDPDECDRETTARCNDEVMGVLERCRLGFAEDLLGCVRRSMEGSECSVCMCQVFQLNGIDLCDRRPVRFIKLL